MPCACHADASEIHRQNIKCSVRCPLEDAGQTADKRIGSVSAHGIHHQSAGPATAQRLHQCSGQCADKLVVYSATPYHPGDALNQKIHGARSTEHTDGNQDGHQVRNDAHGSRKSLFGSLHEGIVHIDSFPHARHDKADDDEKKKHIGKGGRVEVNLFPAKLKEKPDDACNEQTGPSEEQQDGSVQQVDALVQTDRNDAGHRRKESRQ